MDAQLAMNYLEELVEVVKKRENRYRRYELKRAFAVIPIDAAAIKAIGRLANDEVPLHGHCNDAVHRAGQRDVNEREQKEGRVGSDEMIVDFTVQRNGVEHDDRGHEEDVVDAQSGQKVHEAPAEIQIAFGQYQNWQDVAHQAYKAQTRNGGSFDPEHAGVLERFGVVHGGLDANRQLKLSGEKEKRVKKGERRKREKKNKEES